MADEMVFLQARQVSPALPVWVRIDQIEAMVQEEDGNTRIFMYSGFAHFVVGSVGELANRMAAAYGNKDSSTVEVRGEVACHGL